MIPVLLGNTELPAENDLPTAIASLVYRNAARVRPGRDTEPDLQQLVDGLERQFASATDARPAPPKVSKKNVEDSNAFSDKLEVFSDKLKDGSSGPDMVVLPVGDFMMGADDAQDYAPESERPRHRVMITEPFAMARCPITFEQYDRFARSADRKLQKDYNWGRADRPVIDVTWREANDFATWLSEQTGREYRQPTEAEWEYACRAGTETPWFWGSDGDKANDFAWHGINSNRKTQPVGIKKPNPWGLFDMVGNVWEWTADTWHDNYQDAPDDGSAWVGSGAGAHCVLRGGPAMMRPSNDLPMVYLCRDAVDFRKGINGLKPCSLC